VKEVRQTRILVSPLPNGRGLVIYENFVGIDKGVRSDQQKIAKLEEKHKAELQNSNAMILPAPLSSEENEIGLLDLSKGKFDFKKCDDCFPVPLKMTERRSKKAKLASSALKVISLGAYNVSIAKNFADLSRIDTDVFKLDLRIANLLENHYAKGFGFVICIFDASKGIEPHPIGYTCDAQPDGSIFVPCRHEHGKGDENVRFDHKIYSVNTLSLEANENNSGESVEEALQRCNALQETGKYMTKMPTLFPIDLFSADPFQGMLPPIVSFRRREMIGNFPNTDLNLIVVN